MIRETRGKHFSVLNYIYLQLPFNITLKKSEHAIYINIFIRVFIHLSLLHWSNKYALITLLCIRVCFKFLCFAFYWGEKYYSKCCEEYESQW